MPSTVGNDRLVNECTMYKLLQDAGISKASPVNEWITGAPIGSKNAVLVFKTSALFRNVIDDDEMDHQPTTSDAVTREKFRFPPVADAKPKFPHKSTNIKKSFSTSFSTERFSSKGNSDSFSSSENSISSACDDPTDLEADIFKAEKSAGDERKHNVRFSGTKSNNKSCLKSIDGENDERSTKKRLFPVNSEESSADDGDMQAAIGEMPATLLNITFKCINTETKLLKRILTSHGLKEAKDNQNFNLLWTGLHMKPDILRSLLPHQRVNHFPRSYELTRKDRLYKNIERMQHLRGIKYFDIVPVSFMLPLEYRNLVQAHRSGRSKQWIVKPAASSRGRGIYLVNAPEQIPLDDQVIASKYIADPLCIDGHKCDVRLYVAVTSFDPLLIYLYEEGLVRLATVKYDKTAENLWNPCIHLCNYSVNKYHSDYIKATEGDEDVGHKWTFSALLRHLKSQGCDTTALMLAIEDVIIKSIFACSQSIISASRMFVPYPNSCFELYGFDILIDNALKPWLLEVNLSPSLGCDTPLDIKVKSAMLTDLLNLAGIPALSPLTRIAADYKMNGTRFKSAAATMPSSRRSHDSLTMNMGTSSLNRRLNSGLTAEDSRVLRIARTQNDRSGGFVRIFPAQDSMQRFGMFLDRSTGIPLSIINSTSMVPGTQGHNFNQMLHNQFFGDCSKPMKENCVDERMERYERALYSINVDSVFKENSPKSSDEAIRLRKQLRKAIENGNELTLLQARKVFAKYLEFILKRLSQEPRNQHERLILKFITRSDFSIKPPSFITNPYTTKVDGKDRSAIVATLLGHYLEAFNRDTEIVIDDYSYYGLIPSQLFDDFIAQAQECDLETILALHVNTTQNFSFLYGRNSSQTNIPATPPPIPTGAHGFLKALPNMAPNIITRDMARIDLYYRSLSLVASDIEREIHAEQLSLTKNRLSKTAIRSTLA